MLLLPATATLSPGYYGVACFGHNKAIIGDARPGSATGGRWAVPQTPNQATR